MQNKMNFQTELRYDRRVKDVIAYYNKRIDRSLDKMALFAGHFEDADLVDLTADAACKPDGLKNLDRMQASLFLCPRIIIDSAVAYRKRKGDLNSTIDLMENLAYAVSVLYFADRQGLIYAVRDLFEEDLEEQDKMYDASKALGDTARYTQNPEDISRVIRIVRHNKDFPSEKYSRRLQYGLEALKKEQDRRDFLRKLGRFLKIPGCQEYLRDRLARQEREYYFKELQEARGNKR